MNKKLISGFTKTGRSGAGGAGKKMSGSGREGELRKKQFSGSDEAGQQVLRVGARGA